MKRTQRKLLTLCLLFFACLSLKAQHQITGVVTDDAGMQLPGVSVVEKGTTNGTSTHGDGTYRLKLRDANATLVYSFIGFKRKEVQVKSKTKIDVSLEPESIGLDEVVAIGYGTTKKVTMTGAVAQVKSEELKQAPVGSLSNALAGKVPGLTTIQRSGRPGDDAAEILIRGVASLDRASAKPLIIVDGVERSFNELNAEEIESISVLKDASTTAVYGIRGANGVIVVTTKRGQVGRMNINFGASYGLQSRQKMLEKANSLETATVWNEYQAAAGVPKENWYFSDETIEHFKKKDMPLLYPDMDWENYLLKDYAPQQKYNISLSGGTKSARYFANFSYLNQEGLIKSFDTKFDHNSSYKRYDYRLNLDIDVTKSTLLSLNFGASTGVKTGNIREHEIWGRYGIAHPYSGPGIVDGKFYQTSGDIIPAPGMYNPLDRFYKAGVSENTLNKINTDFVVKQDLGFLVKGLSASAKVSFNTSYAITRSRYSEPSIYTLHYKRTADNQFVLDENGNKIVVEEMVKQGQKYWFAKDVKHGSPSLPVHRYWYTEGALNFHRKFKKHEVGALALYNQTVRYYPSEFTQIESAILGMVGRVTYNYDQKYLFDFNMAYNGSENFPKDKRYGFFPSLSAGYVISQEPFMKRHDWVTFLKVRGSWGQVGSDRKGGERFLYRKATWYTDGNNGYNFGIDNPYVRPSAYEGRLGNEDVSWAVSTKYNIGFESKFFDGLVGIDVDLFKEDRTGILLNPSRQTPAHFPLQMPPVNLGEVQNKGYELGLTLTDKIGKFRYHIKGTMAYAKNTIIYNDEVPMPHDYMNRTGKKVGQNFGYRFLGFYTAEQAANVPVGYGSVQEGDCIYEDVNGDDQINDMDQVPIGYPTYPEYTFGLNTNFQWKGFYLALTFTGVTNINHQVWGSIRSPFELIDRGLWKYQHDERWTPETAATATYPRISPNPQNYVNSSLWMRDASYIRLKSAEFGYDFKLERLKGLGIRGARVYMNGYNLLTWTKLKLWDPEMSASPTYPLIKVYNMGINVKF